MCKHNFKELTTKLTASGDDDDDDDDCAGDLRPPTTWITYVVATDVCVFTCLCVFVMRRLDFSLAASLIVVVPIALRGFVSETLNDFGLR